MAKPLPYKAMMQGLYYPAVLGTALVLLLQRVAMDDSLDNVISDLAFLFGLYFALYFSLSFLITHELPDDQYIAEAFFADLIEVVLVFVVYRNLGLLTTDSNETANYSVAFLAFAGVLIVQGIWSLITKTSDPRLLVATGAIFLLVVMHALCWSSSTRHHGRPRFGGWPVS